VSSALFLLYLLALAAPIFLVFDTVAANLWLTLWTALLLGICGFALRPTEVAHVWKIIRALLPLALIPAIWMAIQLLPVPYLAHPIWQSAATAIGAPLYGKISVDPGLTLRALLRYLTVLGVVAAALCVAIDRRRAHQLLRVFAAVTGVIAIVSLIAIAGRLQLAETFGPADLETTFGAIRNLGMLLSASLIVSALDQYLLRRSGNGIGTGVVAEFCFGCAVFAICLAGAFAAPRLVLVAGLCGLIPIFLVAFLRHVPSHGWEKGLVIGIIVIVAGASVLSGFSKDAGALELRAVAGATPVQSGLAARMLADAGPLGTGAGTYAALLPTYRGIDDAGAVFTAPSAAAAISLELGRPGLAAMLAIGTILSVVLFRRALARGRDSLYAAAGSGCAILLMLELFADASLAASGFLILAALTIGLALGQSLSWPRG
jgi:hypothetical protein